MIGKLLRFVSVRDMRGCLVAVEDCVLPFGVKRVFCLVDLPVDAVRGGHANKVTEQVIVALRGSFEVMVNNGVSEERFTLDKPDVGLYVPALTWKELRGFSVGAVVLVFASTYFNEEDYVADFEDFERVKKEVGGEA